MSDHPYLRSSTMKNPMHAASLQGGRSLLADALDLHRAQASSLPAMVRWDKASQFQVWLQQDALPNLTQEQANSLYSASGARKGKEFKTNSLEETCESLEFLLYDPLSLDGRFSECADPEGAYALKGCSKSFVSYLLCLRYPQLFGHWSSYSDRSLSMLGITRPKARKSAEGQGTTYVQYLDLLWSVRRGTGMADFQELDRFLWWLAKKDKAGNLFENAAQGPTKGKTPGSKTHPK